MELLLVAPPHSFMSNGLRTKNYATATPAKGPRVSSEKKCCFQIQKLIYFKSRTPWLGYADLLGQFLLWTLLWWGTKIMHISPRRWSWWCLSLLWICESFFETLVYFWYGPPYSCLLWRVLKPSMTPLLFHVLCTFLTLFSVNLMMACYIENVLCVLSFRDLFMVKDVAKVGIFSH